jgi:Dolichyl-phosphate-mannose-protein mannosyltransferase
MTRPRIHIGRPQRLAALLLLVFFAECLWVVGHQELSTADYRFARCGREMWERPSPVAGYFTTCGNLNGDGTFAYRVAGLPLTLQRLTLLAADHFRAPDNRLYPGGTLNGTTWEARHQLASVIYLIHVPFVLFAVWLGGGLWWVARRLFGNEGGFLALGLYCFCPAVIRMAVTPNNDVLAMWGLYGLVYAAMGVAHAMQGPRRKWRPRIALLTIAIGLTAAAHLLAALLGLVAALIFMLYLSERRRSYVMQIVIFAGVGALVILFAFYGFHLAAFSYVFTGGAARFWFSLAQIRSFIFARGFADTLVNFPILIAAAVALLLYFGARRCRYFGNTAPLLMLLALAPIVTTQTVTAPWQWTLPFLFTFIGGVFADALETRYRKLFLALTGTILAAQAMECLASLPLLAR